ncbi:MFS transporter [Gemmobacter denitrificans]|uniref:MFS transporter n=1 Tax=Gemmobacter denitrificans TaxID=3123040 RepID=A0ABU8BZU3_9RHOB
MALIGVAPAARPVIAALGVTQIIGYGALYYAYAVLTPAMATDFNVTEPTLFAIFSIGLLLGGFTAPAFGRRIDRHGAARVMSAGSAAVAAALVALAHAPDIVTFALLVVLIEIISFAVLYDAAFATLALHAPRNTRAAITLLTLIAGFASTLFWPLTGWLAEDMGWRGTYLIFAGLTLGLALPLHLWIARRPLPDPAAIAAHPAQTEVQYQRLSGPEARRAFWLMGVGFAISGMVISAVTIHMVPILLARGMGETAFLIAMMMGPAQVLIRVVDATLWRNLHPVAVAMVSAGAMPLAVLALLLPGPPVLTGLCFAILMGTGGGLASIVRGAVPVALFGTEGLGQQLGRLAAIRNLMGAAAPFAFALSTTRIGPGPTLWLVVALGLTGLAVMAILWRKVSRAQAWPATG